MNERTGAGDGGPRVGEVPELLLHVCVEGNVDDEREARLRRV